MCSARVVWTEEEIAHHSDRGPTNEGWTSCGYFASDLESRLLVAVIDIFFVDKSAKQAYKASMLDWRSDCGRIDRYFSRFGAEN
jgi:hypothetical protein